MTARLNAVRAVCSVILVSAFVVGRAAAQDAVPLKQLSAPSAVALQKFGSIESVHPQADNGLLVNDSKSHMLIALDSTMQRTTVVLDSSQTAAQQYGSRASTLHTLFADSTIFRESKSGMYVVIDPHGDIVRPLISAVADEQRRQYGMAQAFDAHGNALGLQRDVVGDRPPMRGPPKLTAAGEMRSVVRVNGAQNKSERVGDVKVTMQNLMQSHLNELQVLQIIETVNPLVVSDDWLPLSDGSIALVHADKYRVEIISPSGKKISSKNFPFDKRKLNDADKRIIQDSVRAELIRTTADSANSSRSSALLAMTGMTALMRSGALRTPSQGGPVSVTLQINTAPVNGKGENEGTIAVAADRAAIGDAEQHSVTAPTPTIEMVPLNDMADHMPPFIVGTSKADADGNVWVKRTIPVGVSVGENLYDVINNRAKLIQRVRIPAGRELAGFGHGGVVYLKHKDGNVWVLERTNVLQ